MKVTVVGAGVIGLVTALVLEEDGHEVTLVAADEGDATTSAVAAAIWFPYRCGPVDRVTTWAITTRAWLEALAHERDAGVDTLTDYEITHDEDPWWRACIDAPARTDGDANAPAPASIRAPEEGNTEAQRYRGPDRKRDLPPADGGDARRGDGTNATDATSLNSAEQRVPAPVVGAPLAWRYRAPRVEPALFLPWLASRLRARIERRRVLDLEREAGDVIVNCTGLAARELVGDTALAPLFGQVVITEVGGVDRTIAISDERDLDDLFYLIPRRDELVLGGCALPRDTTEIDPAITARILEHARALGLAVGAVKRVRAGLRPFRPDVRLERVGRIIHNYGHGGAGFTLARGCAEDVARLVTLH